MSEAEYLALDESSEDKYEYRNGRVYAITGSSPNHALITVNAGTEININLGNDDCAVYSSDLKIHVATSTVRSYRHPDFSVVCGDLEHANDRTDLIVNPILLVEVLSPSTALIDRNEKLEEYTHLASLRDFLLISQDRPRVELYTRQDSGKWTYEAVTGLDSTIYLPSLDCTLALSRIYRRVVWD